MFGMGGIFVEIYRDVHWSRSSEWLRRGEMIRDRGVSVLAGARAARQPTLSAARALTALGYATARDELDSIDIRPLIVLTEGKAS
jgi:urease accessory protein UreF